MSEWHQARETKTEKHEQENARQQAKLNASTLSRRALHAIAQITFADQQ